MFLLILFVCINAEYVSFSIVSGHTYEPFHKSLLVNSFLQYVQHKHLDDMGELRLNGNSVIPWTQMRRNHKIIDALEHVNLEVFQNRPCIDNFFLDQIKNNSTLYLIMDKNPCNSQLSEITLLKNRGAFIFPIGFGSDVLVDNLIDFAHGNISNVDYILFSN